MKKDKNQVTGPDPASMERVKRFAGGVAHDLNNLLTGILGFSSLAMMELKEDDPVYKYCQEIGRVAKDAVVLSEKLSAISGREKSVPASVSLGEVTEKAAGKAKQWNGTRPITASGLEKIPALAADGKKLQIAIELVLYRAIMTTEEGGDICIHAKVQTAAESEPYPGKQVLLTVACRGTRAKIEELKFLFEPIYTSSRDKLLGCELAVASEILMEQGASISAEINESDRALIFNVAFSKLTE